MSGINRCLFHKEIHLVSPVIGEHRSVYHLLKFPGREDSLTYLENITNSCIFACELTILLLQQMKTGSIFRFIKENLEAFIWLLALILLACMPPESTQSSLCLLHHLGFSWCPGCGLGHAISSFFHFRFVLSFNQHPLGIFAVVVLISRICTVFYQYYTFHYQNSNHYGKNL